MKSKKNETGLELSRFHWKPIFWVFFQTLFTINLAASFPIKYTIESMVTLLASVRSAKYGKRRLVVRAVVALTAVLRSLLNAYF